MEPLNRAETLRILQSMGVDLPDSTTKLSDAVLDKRLRDVLDASQYKDRLSSALDLRSLKDWPLPDPSEVKVTSWPIKNPKILTPPARSVHDTIQRVGFNEAAQNPREILRTSRHGPPTLYVDPFTDLRQTLMVIGMYVDGGVRWCLLQDKEKEQCAIAIRVVSVLEVDENTPAIVVLYRSFIPSDLMACAQWTLNQADSNPPCVGRSIINVTATPLEQKLLLKVLKVNAPLVPPDFTIERQRGEEHFSVSVLLPVGPLEFDALAKLNEKQGCSVCGKKTTSRCSQCQSASYCGSECQRADWKSHKQTCRSLKGGRWCTARFRKALPGMEHLYAVSFNRYGTTGGRLKRPDASPQVFAKTAPPNVWGDKLFLVKIQISLGEELPVHMMVYDMKRSFQVFLAREDDPPLFMDMHAEMVGPRGGYGGIKMYRWAKRVGDWQLNICLDREPRTEIKW